MVFFPFAVNSAVGQTAENDTTGSFSVIESSMERLNQLNEEVLTFWKDQNIKLEMYIQWKHWERDAVEVQNILYISNNRHCLYKIYFLFIGFFPVGNVVSRAQRGSEWD